MRYDDTQLVDSLSAEYVIGTLRGPARGRFTRLLSTHVHIRRAVRNWEERLLPLSLGVPPVSPPASVWRDIEQRLNLGPSHQSTPDRSAWWRAIAASAAIVAIALGVTLMTREPPLITPSHVSIVSDTEGAPVWLVQIREQRRELDVKVISEAAPPEGKSYELWMLPVEGTPISLGVLPDSGSVRVALTSAAFDALIQTDILAVSLEPEGGSPTGLPTGPVVYTAVLVRS